MMLEDNAFSGETHDKVLFGHGCLARINPAFTFGASWEDIISQSPGSILLDNTAKSKQFDFKQTAQELYRTIHHFPEHFLLTADMQQIPEDLGNLKLDRLRLPWNQSRQTLAPTVSCVSTLTAC